MKINNKQLQNSPKFNGLNTVLKKEIFSKGTIKQLSSYYPNSHGIVGNLPPQWIKNIPLEKREDYIKNIYLELGICANEIRNNFVRSLDFYKDKIEKILKKYNAINDDTTVIMTRIGSGAYSIAYKINNLVLKIFYEESPSDSLSHGVYSESNTKIYLNHNLRQKDKLNFSHFYYSDINNGYYLEDYIEGSKDPDLIKNANPYTIQKILKKLNLNHSDLHNENYKIDNNGNIIVFDCGGIRKIVE